MHSLQSAENYTFFPAEDIWKVSRNVTINVSWIRLRLGSPLDKSVRKTLEFYATTFSSSHLQNAATRMSAFFQHSSFAPRTSICRVDLPDLVSYWRTLNRRNEWYMSTIRKFLNQMYDLESEGVAEETLSYIDKWAIKGNIKGEAVRTRDVFKSAFSDEELQGLHLKLASGLESGLIDLQEFVCVHLFLAFGARSCQLSDLRACDLELPKPSDPTRSYRLKIPRAKTRSSKFREFFTERPLTFEIGESVRALCAANQALVETALGALTSEQTSNLPVFLDALYATRITQSGFSIDDCIMRTDLLHGAADRVAGCFSRTIAVLQIPSERTQGFLSATSVRARRTLGTRLAREGASVFQIAKALDHSGIESADVYTEDVAESVAAKDLAMSGELAPIAGRFMGKIVANEAAAVRGTDPSSRVRLKHDRTVGTCGNGPGCFARAPFACYTCRSFQPWLEANHNEVVMKLEELREQTFADTNDLTLASANDYTIRAAREVADLCRSMMAPKAAPPSSEGPMPAVEHQGSHAARYTMDENDNTETPRDEQ